MDEMYIFRIHHARVITMMPHLQYFAYLSGTLHTFLHLAQIAIAKFLRQVHITMAIATTYIPDTNVTVLHHVLLSHSNKSL